MYPRITLAVLALSGALGLSLAKPAAPQASPSTSPPPSGVTLGSDGPPDPATLGNFLFQTNVHVRDVAASFRFYGDALGMRHIISLETPAKDWSLTLLAHGQGGRNGTGFMTGPELASEAKNLAGLIELTYSREWNEQHPHRTIPSSETGLSHIAIVVPDAQATQDRLERAGYTIVKPLGVNTAKSATKELAVAFGVDYANKTRVAEVFGLLDSAGFPAAFHVADPDGNIVEVAQADRTPLGS